MKLPREIAAVLSALRFPEPSCSSLADLSEPEWDAALSFCDRTQLTLPLGQTCRASLPERVRARTDRNLADNTERHRRWTKAFLEIAGRLEENRAEYLLLKGFSHDSEYAQDPRVRAQYDIDLYCPRESLEAARRAVQSLGYEPLGADLSDHLPAMVRKTGWEWRGDYYDPDIPFAVDIHFRFWDRDTERFDAPGVAEFWSRRCERQLEGKAIPVLHPADRLGYASLHALRHLLRGSVRLYHMYEIGYFLQTHAGNDAFWTGWRALHPAELQRLEAIVFRLAHEWFGCSLPEEAAGDTAAWFAHYSHAPLEALVRPNKDELWLHLSLLDSAADKWRVLRRRLLPATMPGPVDAVLIPDAEMTRWRRLRASVNRYRYAASRAVHHARALLPFAWHGVRWCWRAPGLGEQFWIFLFAENLYDFGIYIFFLLYNLYLLDLGYREDFLGWMASAMAVGSIAGALPAAWIVRRFGLRETMIAGSAVAAMVCAARSFPLAGPALVTLAFLGGAASSVWAVCLAPLVATLTTERNRAIGFSLWTGRGIALGALCGVIGGRLPGWMRREGLAGSPAQLKQVALLMACAIAITSVWPLSRLRVPRPERHEARIFPRNAFIVRFLLPFAVWNLAVGAFNPFFTAYFSRHLHMAVERIGEIFSAAQLVQVAAVLLAPVVLRALGAVSGIAAMQLGTALALGLLASGPTGIAAGALYAAFMGFQYMSEPGTFTLLMTGTAANERSGASALSLLVTFCAQAVAAAAAGVAVTRFGYSVALGAACAVAVLAALLFWRLLRGGRG